MTREETRDIVRTIMGYYPQWKPENLTKVVDDWHDILDEYDADVIMSELKHYIKSEKGTYIPNISNLIPKQKEVYGFKGRTYSPEFFEELEREISDRYRE